MTADLLSHSRRGRKHISYPLVMLGACVLVLISCGVPLRACMRHAQARMHGAAVSNSRRRAAPLTLGVALCTTTGVVAQVSCGAQCHARAHDALTSHLSLCCF